MTQIGDQFRTGEKAPVSGDYEYVRHIDFLGCTRTPAERHIPLSVGETFPPHKSCGKGVIWKLIQRR